MIFDAILLLLTTISYGVVSLLKIIPFVVPASWQTAITQIFSYFGYFQGWLPIYPDPTASGLWAITGLMQIFGTFISALVAIYLVKGAVMLFHLFTLGHVSLKIPTFGKGRTISKD